MYIKHGSTGELRVLITPIAADIHEGPTVLSLRLIEIPFAINLSSVPILNCDQVDYLFQLPCILGKKTSLRSWRLCTEAVTPDLIMHFSL